MSNDQKSNPATPETNYAQQLLQRVRDAGIAHATNAGSPITASTLGISYGPSLPSKEPDPDTILGFVAIHPGRFSHGDKVSMVNSANQLGKSTIVKESLEALQQKYPTSEFLRSQEEQKENFKLRDELFKLNRCYQDALRKLSEALKMPETVAALDVHKLKTERDHFEMIAAQNSMANAITSNELNKERQRADRAERMSKKLDAAFAVIERCRDEFGNKAVSAIEDEVFRKYGEEQ